MQVDLNSYELYDLFKSGSTNQKYFAKCIDDFNLTIDDTFETIENIFNDYEIKDDIRSLINGGVLYITNETNDQFINIELKDGVYLIIE